MGWEAAQAGRLQGWWGQEGGRLGWEGDEWGGWGQMPDLEHQQKARSPALPSWSSSSRAVCTQSVQWMWGLRGEGDSAGLRQPHKHHIHPFSAQSSSERAQWTHLPGLHLRLPWGQVTSSLRLGMAQVLWPGLQSRAPQEGKHVTLLEHLLWANKEADAKR